MRKSHLSAYAAGIVLCTAALCTSADESARPAKISRADIAGAIFKSPKVQKVTEGGTQALEVDTLLSADKKQEILEGGSANRG